MRFILILLFLVATANAVTVETASNKFWLYGDTSDEIQIVGDVDFYDVQSDYYIAHSPRFIALEPGNGLLTTARFNKSGQIKIRTMDNILYSGYIPEPATIMLLGLGIFVKRRL